MNTRTKAILVICAFIAICTMDYADEQAELAHCQQMKKEGVWPKGYQCE